MPKFLAELEVLKTKGPQLITRIDPEGEEVATKPSLVAALAVGCTDTEIAGLFNMTEKELETTIRADPDLAKLWDGARAARRFQLREAITHVAINGEGMVQAAMLKFLGQTELATEAASISGGDKLQIRKLSDLYVVDVAPEEAPNDE